MNVLFITSAHNSLSQRLAIELRERGHTVHVAVTPTGDAMSAAVTRYAPDLIVAPMLKVAIPRAIWSRHRCLIVHPGVVGDRGPSALDWALHDDVPEWGVTVLEATDEMDAGPIWSAQTFRLPRAPVTKSGLYRNEVTEAAVRGVLEAVARHAAGGFVPRALDAACAAGRLRPPMRQADRAIDWSRDGTDAIARRIRAADGQPGLLDTIGGREFHLYGAHAEDCIRGAPGALLAQRHGAICRGTVDGAVWITHLRARERGACAGIKLPAVQALGDLGSVPEAPLALTATPGTRTLREIHYAEQQRVGFLAFEFYNGAMSADQCRRLRDAVLFARSRPTKVIVLLGGRDFWSNGIHLNMIEAAADPAMESWRNINAIDDLIGELLDTPSHLLVAGLRGNAGAGGAMLALAADRVYARRGVVINPHYKTMGGLFGSEYWTYTLPRRVGWNKALELTEGCQPIGTRAAVATGLLDDAFGDDVDTFEQHLRQRAIALANDPRIERLLVDKRERWVADQAAKPFAAYRAEELAQMWRSFFADGAYHEARRRFVLKSAPGPRGTVTAARVPAPTVF